MRSLKLAGRAALALRRRRTQDMCACVQEDTSYSIPGASTACVRPAGTTERRGCTDPVDELHTPLSHLSSDLA